MADKVIVMTPRPGRVRETINITLLRPRDIDTMGSPEFAKLGMEIRELLMKN